MFYVLNLNSVFALKKFMSEDTGSTESSHVTSFSVADGVVITGVGSVVGVVEKKEVKLTPLAVLYYLTKYVKQRRGELAMMKKLIDPASGPDNGIEFTLGTNIKVWGYPLLMQTRSKFFRNNPKLRTLEKLEIKDVEISDLAKYHAFVYVWGVMNEVIDPLPVSMRTKVTSTNDWLHTIQACAGALALMRTFMVSDDTEWESDDQANDTIRGIIRQAWECVKRIKDTPMSINYDRDAIRPRPTDEQWLNILEARKLYGPQDKRTIRLSPLRDLNLNALRYLYPMMVKKYLDESSLHAALNQLADPEVCVASACEETVRTYDEDDMRADGATYAVTRTASSGSRDLLSRIKTISIQFD